MFGKARFKEVPRFSPGRASALALAVATGALVAVAAAGAGGESRPRDDCVQRVKVWSPSQQAHIMRLQNFCG